jgi:hypothetical protein
MCKPEAGGVLQPVLEGNVHDFHSSRVVGQFEMMDNIARVSIEAEASG